MKKIFSFLAAAAMLFAASCTKDNVGTDNGNDTQVTFNLSLEGQSGTRAIGDGLSVNKLYFAVYGENDDKTAFTLLRDASVNAATADRGTVGVAFDGTYNLSLKLAKDQTYKVVFWAHKEVAQGEQYYTFDSAKGELTVNYNVNGNIEERDAFFKVETITVTGSKQINVVLTRPFAQLNVGVTAKDYQDAEHSGVVITKSWAKVTGVYNTLNLLDGNVEGEPTTAEFDMATTPNEYLVVDGVEYKYLSMNYVLVGDQKNVSAEFEFATNSYVDENNKGKTIAFKSGLDVVPVERNYRTNLVGQILTGNLDFNVTIDKNFKDEYNPTNTPSTEEELRVAVASGVSEITLTENITLTQPLVIENAGTKAGISITPIVINLNGKTITTELKSEGRHHYAIDNYGVLVLEGEGAINARGIENFGTMTINGNITITNIDTNGGSAIWNEGNLTINGGTFKTTTEAGEGSYGSALNTQVGGKAVVNGGTFEAYSNLTYAICNYGETIINNATVKGKHGAVAAAEDASIKTVINGGSFELMENPGVSDHCLYYVSTVNGGTFTLGANTDSGAKVFYESTIAEGYKAVEKGGKYYVVAEQVDAVVGSKEDLPKTTDGTKFNTIFEENVTLFGDITVSAGETNANSGYEGATGVEVTNGAVLDGQGNTLTINDANTTWSCAIAAKGGTIKNLTVSGAMRGIFMPGANGDVYIDNVIFKNVIYTFNSDDGNKNYGVYISNSTLNGWTSHSDVHKEVVYTNCKFGEGNGYAFCRPYGPTTFKGCDFEEGFEVEPLGKVTFENCTIGGVALTAENLSTLVIGNIANATVK